MKTQKIKSVHIIYIHIFVQRINTMLVVCIHTCIQRKDTMLVVYEIDTVIKILSIVSSFNYIKVNIIKTTNAWSNITF